MTVKKFKMSASISSNNPLAIKPVLENNIGDQGTIRSTAEGFEVVAVLEGESAKDLNRVLLSTMRKIEKKTRIRAEYASEDKIEKFFDYVLKATRHISQT